MRSYILQFSQSKAVKLKLNLQELLILYHLIDYFNSGHAEYVQGVDKNFFWIRYSKIVKDLPILNIEVDRVRQIINKLCDMGILEKWQGNEHMTKVYLFINQNMLAENPADDLTQVTGADSSLKLYYENKTNINVYNLIKYNGFNYYYECPAIDNQLLSDNADLFISNLKNYMQLLLSDTVYKMGMQRSAVTFQTNNIVLNYEMPEAVISMNVHKIERAIVDAYISVIRANKGTKKAKQFNLETVKEIDYSAYLTDEITTNWAAMLEQIKTEMEKVSKVDYDLWIKPLQPIGYNKELQTIILFTPQKTAIERLEKHSKMLVKLLSENSKVIKNFVIK